MISINFPTMAMYLMHLEDFCYQKVNGLVKMW